MHAVVFGAVDSAFPKARIAFVFFRTGVSADGTEIHIIGPP